YNNPLLSYVVDVSNLLKEIKSAFDEQALITMVAPPIKFYREMDPTSEKYLVYLYKNQKQRRQIPGLKIMIAKNLHEIVFAETSETLFQATCTTKKVYNDKCKLIRFEHDSKNKMLDELIEKKCIYLSDWKNLYGTRKSEFLYVNSNIKYLIMNRLKKKIKPSHTKRTKMNYIRVEDEDSGDIYDKFFRIYDPRKVFA
ncbi:6755_t:CDS:2, partial [Gigaspora margarita]